MKAKTKATAVKVAERPIQPAEMHAARLALGNAEEAVREAKQATRLLFLMATSSSVDAEVQDMIQFIASGLHDCLQGAALEAGVTSNHLDDMVRGIDPAWAAANPASEG